MSKQTASQYLENIPRILDASNIQQAISDYLEILKEVKLPVKEDNVYSLLRTLKRDPLKSGPYIGVSAFEAANRIMTDLTILYGVQVLLNDSRFVQFKQYTVEYGNENKNIHDITASCGAKNLYGEAFNVAPSFFQSKKSSSWKKLRTAKTENDVLLLLYNSDACVSTKTRRTNENEYRIGVNVEI